mmetsp:Transcript_8246/g.26180  ORF Transcript_8246/g.26180 Transcript_8246/m.26180 type:complete len:102 (+) Transcript_8246:45-350(+)
MCILSHCRRPPRSRWPRPAGPQQQPFFVFLEESFFELLVFLLPFFPLAVVAVVAVVAVMGVVAAVMDGAVDGAGATSVAAGTVAVAAGAAGTNWLGGATKL